MYKGVRPGLGNNKLGTPKAVSRLVMSLDFRGNGNTNSE